jgi:hypothetical protein
MGRQPSSRISFAKRRHAPAPPRALGDFQRIEDDLGRNALDAIVSNFTVQPFQAQAPGIDRGRNRRMPPLSDGTAPGLLTVAKGATASP